jgi:hypothetical protein
MSIAAFARRHARDWWHLWAIGAWGTALRVWYFWITPYNLRAYDTTSHLQYIWHVMQTGQMPPLWTIWEAHQPPLYYFLMAGWGKIAESFGVTPELLPNHLKVFSFIFAIAGIALGAWVATILFPKNSGRMKSAMVLLVPTFLPSYVFMSTRISNDVLTYPLMLLWFGLFLLWWKNDGERWLWPMSIALGVTLLTKLSAAPFVPAVLLCMLLKQGLTMKRKIWIGFIFCALVMLIAAWQALVRSAGAYTDFMLMTGSGWLDDGLIVKQTVFNYVLFNPVSLVVVPFAESWGQTPDRSMFWEYFFRSAFYAEWAFTSLVWLGRATMALALPLLAVMAAGVWKSANEWKKWGLPLLSTLVLSLVFMVTYAVLHPCACTQDFRFVPMVAPIAAALTALGLDVLPVWLRKIAFAGAIIIAVLCSAFIVLLKFFP